MYSLFSGVSRTNTKRSYNETYIREDSEFDSRAGNRTSRLHTKEECTMLENLIVDPEFEEKIPGYDVRILEGLPEEELLGKMKDEISKEGNR